MLSKWIKETRMGFRPVQAGIMRRFLREEGAWASHLNNSRDYILNAVKEVKPKSIRVLGSGWLLDIPIKELVEICDSVVLEDIVHPPQIINKYSKIDKIKFNYSDVTNGIVDLCYAQKKGSFRYDSFIFELSGFEPKSFSEDLIISANILSQTSIMLTDYLSKKLKLTGSQVASISEIIQQKTFDALPKGRSVIISDYEEEYYDDDKFIGSKPTLFISLPINDSRKEWSWSFDTKMFYKEDCKTKLKVEAVRI